LTIQLDLPTNNRWSGPKMQRPVRGTVNALDEHSALSCDTSFAKSLSFDWDHVWSTPLQVAILIFDEVEVLDAMGPFEVFSVASRLRSADSEPFTVSLVARSNAVVTARGGLKLIPDAVFDDIAKYDLLIVPGGVTERAEADAETMHWLALHGTSSKLVASVCTGAFLLAKAGILTDQTVTTHWEDTDALAEAYPALTVLENTRWLNSGIIYTSAGISAGIDLSLHLVEVMTSADQAHRTARQMDYRWVRN
jgi:transcriptional regulator GlxA family with amidase domain